MRSGSGALALLMVLGCVGAVADTAKDVPANHWARKYVEAALARGVMSAPGGKFRGDARVTRTELIQTMAGFGRSLEKGAWQPATGRKFKQTSADAPSPVATRGVTRYELASLVAKLGSYSASGIPKAGPKRFGTSTALPKPFDMKGVNKNDPAYADLRYLARNRMIWPNSALARSGSELVSGKDVTDAAAAVITGVIDLRTDEPQNREDLGPPPSRNRGTPSTSGAARP